MIDYIKRETAIKLVQGTGYADQIKDNLLFILRTIPALTIVRCKDCRHRDPEDHKCDSGEAERQGCPFKVADNYFCAYGER